MSIKAIHTLKGKLHLSDADYRDLQRAAGVCSARDLTPEADKAVMEALRDLETRQQQSPARKPAEAKIWALWYAVKPYLPAEQQNVAYLLGIIGRVIGYPIRSAGYYPRLDSKECYKIIEALKARLKQETWQAAHPRS